MRWGSRRRRAEPDVPRARRRGPHAEGQNRDLVARRTPEAYQGACGERPEGGPDREARHSNAESEPLDEHTRGVGWGRIDDDEHPARACGGQERASTPVEHAPRGPKLACTNTERSGRNFVRKPRGAPLTGSSTYVAPAGRGRRHVDLEPGFRPGLPPPVGGRTVKSAAAASTAPAMTAWRQARMRRQQTTIAGPTRSRAPSRDDGARSYPPCRRAHGAYAW